MACDIDDQNDFSFIQSERDLFALNGRDFHTMNFFHFCNLGAIHWSFNLFFSALARGYLHKGCLLTDIV